MKKPWLLACLVLAVLHEPFGLSGLTTGDWYAAPNWFAGRLLRATCQLYNPSHRDITKGYKL
jgi:hypothetical protein